MAAVNADRDLLFGLLALQNGIINHSQLLAAFQAWTLDRFKSLAEHLGDRGDLDDDDRGAIEALAARHLKRHGGELKHSLAGMGASRSTRESLARLADVDIDASLAHLARRPSRTSMTPTAQPATASAPLATASAPPAPATPSGSASSGRTPGADSGRCSWR